MTSQTETLAQFYGGKTVAITGVCCTVGAELLRQFATFVNVEIVGIDNNESELFFFLEAHKSAANIDFFVGDIRDADTLRDRLRGVDVVFPAAALKHV